MSASTDTMSNHVHNGLNHILTVRPDRLIFIFGADVREGSQERALAAAVDPDSTHSNASFSYAIQSVFEAAAQTGKYRTETREVAPHFRVVSLERKTVLERLFGL